jgi:uroporphyrinogen decarboxylase
MNARERIQAVLRHEKPDRVPRMVNFYPTEFGPHPGRDDEVRLDTIPFDTDIRFLEVAGPPEQVAFLRYLESLPKGTYVGRLDTLRTYHAWGYHPEIERHAPLGDASSAGEIAAAPPPGASARIRPNELRREVAAWHARGYPVMASPPHLGGELFETAYRLRGFERFMIDLADNPRFVEYLLDQLTAMHVTLSLDLTRSGIDILALDDDVAEPGRMLMSPATWRRFFKPRVRSIIDACRAMNPRLAIFWHSDGNIEPIIPDLIEIGVDILHPVQPDVMDPARLKRLHGDRLAFFGTVGTPATWSWGTPAEIRAEVRERIATVGKDGGLIIAPAYDLEPAENIPWANVRAFFEAADEFGRY